MLWQSYNSDLRTNALRKKDLLERHTIELNSKPAMASRCSELLPPPNRLRIGYPLPMKTG